MSAKKWHKGPPPSVGWWPCRSDGGVDSSIYTVNALRWWNGDFWSVPVSKQEGAAVAPHVLNGWAGIKTSVRFARIEWQNRPASWPKRSKT